MSHICHCSAISLPLMAANEGAAMGSLNSRVGHEYATYSAYIFMYSHLNSYVNVRSSALAWGREGFSSRGGCNVSCVVCKLTKSAMWRHDAATMKTKRSVQQQQQSKSDHSYCYPLSLPLPHLLSFSSLRLLSGGVKKQTANGKRQWNTNPFKGLPNITDTNKHTHTNRGHTHTHTGTLSGHERVAWQKLKTKT